MKGRLGVGHRPLVGRERSSFCGTVREVSGWMSWGRARSRGLVWKEVRGEDGGDRSELSAHMVCIYGSPRGNFPLAMARASSAVDPPRLTTEGQRKKPAANGQGYRVRGHSRSGGRPVCPVA